MTRYTNVGIKRNFFQAGFSEEGGAQHAASEQSPDASASNSASAESAKKRNKKSHPDSSTTATNAESEAIKNAYEGRGKSKGRKFEKSDKPDFSTKRVNASGYLKRKEKEGKGDEKKEASEQRRLQRIQERQANTTCFACREKGHAAKDCPSAKELMKGHDDAALEGEGGQHQKKSVVPLTGICYRCGSSKHSLSRCRKPEDSSNPLPFASCFVCSGKGHLASKCPQNKSKGVYPNGGSCKLCGETSHLARDCELRKQEKLQTTVILGTGDAVGADEDDFHSIKRTTAQIDQEEKTALKLSKKLAKKTATSAADVKQVSVFKAPAAKKVVVF